MSSKGKEEPPKKTTSMKGESVKPISFPQGGYHMEKQLSFELKNFSAEKINSSSLVLQQKQFRPSVSQVLSTQEKELKVKTPSLENKTQERLLSEVNTPESHNSKKELLFENLISVKTVAEMLGLAPKTIHNWVHLRKIPYVKCGQKVMFRPKSLKAWLNRKETKSWL